MGAVTTASNRVCCNNCASPVERNKAKEIILITQRTEVKHEDINIKHWMWPTVMKITHTYK